jgi:hypothetical protein
MGGHSATKRATREGFAQPAHFLGQILHLGEPVLDAQNGLVVDMELRLVTIRRDRRGVDVDQPVMFGNSADCYAAARS